ncbi:MAG: hypothetical protein V1678_01630 [Candidatus Aenigmatarchaeota archaeon]
MITYEAKLKGYSPEILTEDEISDYFHFFSKEEIEYVIELPDDGKMGSLGYSGIMNDQSPTSPKRNIC